MISVIIPTYKEPKYLDLCLYYLTLNDQNDYTWEAVVVIDGTYEDNKTVIEKWGDNSRINFLVLEKNIGFSRAVNFGVHSAKYSHILIINDDNVPNIFWYELLFKAKNEQKYNKKWIITPNQIEPQPSFFKQFKIVNLGKEAFEFDEYKFIEICKNSRDLPDTDDGSTFPIFMNRMMFLALGGFDEYYPGNNVSDWDFFLKAKLMDFNFIRLNKCPFYHFGSKALNQLNDKIEKEMKAFNYSKEKWKSVIRHDVEKNLKYL